MLLVLKVYAIGAQSQCYKSSKSMSLKSLLLAEDEGFKPPIPKKGIPDFESSAFGHSANLPK